MAFPREFIDELIAKSDIADVVGGYVTLTEKGGRFWGLCPFHGEKTPSFSVNRDRQMYYCFGCKKGGGVINFVMELEHLTYPEAVEFLARRAGLELPAQTDNANYEEYKKLKKQIADINREAARFFVEQLYAPAGAAALEYVKKRGITRTTAMKFGLGFAPDSWTALYDSLRAKGADAELLLRAGLARKKDDRYYDFFRNRVMFPVLNSFGDVIAFGGRVMDDSLPKYLNSPDTPMFNKRKNLYAINLLKEERGIRHAVLTEGYMDVISLYQAGVRGTVASLGTALTSEQAYLLKRYVKNVYVSYDGDGAGVSAAIKACGILQGAEMNARVIAFGNEDPDEFVRKNGFAGFQHKMKDSRDPVDFKLDILKRDYDMDDIDGRTQYSLAALKLIERIDNSVLRERYSRRIAEETRFSYDSIVAEAGRGGTKEQERRPRTEAERESDTDEHVRTEREFVAAALANAVSLPQEMEILTADDFADGLAQKMIILINDRVKRGIPPTGAEIISEMEQDEAAEAAQFLAADGDITYDLHMLAGRVKLNAMERDRRRLGQRVKMAEGAEKTELSRQYMELSREINSKKRQVR